MKNKANKLTLSVTAMAVTLLCAGNLAYGQNVFPSNGNVGIGTSTPEVPLDVIGKVQVRANGTLLYLVGTDHGYISFYPDGAAAGRKGYIGFGSANEDHLHIANETSTGDVRVFPGPGRGMYITGKVGIGTTKAGKEFEVVGNIVSRTSDEVGATAVSLVAEGPGLCSLWTNDSYDPARQGSGWRRIFNFVGGNVGIGTTSPQAKLDVDGQIRSTTLLLTSDRHAKTNFLPVDARAVLQKVASLSLSTWQYTNALGVRHLGPMAQDFKAAFPDLGEDDKHIATVDADGVALASIQALHQMVQEKDSEIAALQRQVSALKTELAGVKESVADRLAAIEKAMSRNNLQQASLPPHAVR